MPATVPVKVTAAGVAVMAVLLNVPLPMAAPPAAAVILHCAAVALPPKEASPNSTASPMQVV